VVTVEFEAGSTIPSTELVTFAFDVATLERDSPRRNTWSVRTQQRQAQRYIERLGNSIFIAMVAIPGGSFVMGSPSDEPERFSREGPQHDVQVSEFFMGRYPVTQIQWRAVAAMPHQARELNPDPSHFKGDNRPVEQVSWYDAVEFCARLSAHTGREYRLPTEAEWEYACRARTTTPFSFGDMITPEVANYNGGYAYNSGPKGENRGETTAVDHFKVANGFGLSDMHGNVYEWCQDHYHRNYEGAPTDGRAWEDEEAKENKSRVIRGGAWGSSPRHCRSADRYYFNPRASSDNFGFRVVCVAPRAL
jgi:formylglycine-generating enzyme required for sulfatase activity